MYVPAENTGQERLENLPQDTGPERLQVIF